MGFIIIRNFKHILRFFQLSLINCILWKQAKGTFRKLFPPVLLFLKPLEIDICIAIVSSQNTEVLLPVFILFQKAFAFIVLFLF